MTDGFSCDMCLRSGTVVTTERDGQVLRLRHDPCPTCGGTTRAPAGGQRAEWARWPSRIVAQTRARLREHGMCTYCLGAGVVVNVGDGDLPTRVVSAGCPACG